MRSDIVPGAAFPDYELSDHAAKRRKLSELQGPRRADLDMNGLQRADLAAYFESLPAPFTQPPRAGSKALMRGAILATTGETRPSDCRRVAEPLLTSRGSLASKSGPPSRRGSTMRTRRPRRPITKHSVRPTDRIHAKRHNSYTPLWHRQNSQAF